MFITIDGGDGSGKGRQIEFLKEWFGENGVEFEFFHDPGNTDVGDAIRELLLHRKDLNICSRAELALFAASRAQLVQEKILPALQSGKIVLLDRYLLSTAVYQGFAAGASEEELVRLWQIGSFLANNVLPDITFILDCPFDIALQRLNRVKDRIESKGVDYHKQVVAGYKYFATNWQKYTVGKAFVVDATKSPEKVFEEIRSILERRLFSESDS